MTVMERDQIVMVTCKPVAARWRNVTNNLSLFLPRTVSRDERDGDGE